MAWTIPDKGEGDNDIQSILFQEDLEVLVAGVSGVDCVLSGLAVTGGADMTPAVAKGSVLTNRLMKAVAAADVTVTAADGTNPRLDLIVVNSSGALAVRAGTPAAAPKPPARTANDVVIAQVYVPASDTTIATTQTKDRRVTPPFPLCIYRTAAAETTNNTSGVIEILDKTNSGVVIPDGLFVAGRMLRVNIYGNALINSGTPTVTLAILYGGTTMFSDVSAAAVADTDRRAWKLSFDLVAQANNDQAMIGSMLINDFQAAFTGPGTGIGDAWSQNAQFQETQTPIGGSAAVDSDAADRTLSCRWTFSVANANNEVIVEGATVELL
jgi:hypothetical protein